MQEIRTYTVQLKNCSFIRQHTCIYVPQPPPCPLPTAPPLEDVDETQVSKVSKDAFPLILREDLPLTLRCMSMSLTHGNPAQSHRFLQPFLNCKEKHNLMWRKRMGPRLGTIQRAVLQTSGFSHGVDEEDENKQTNKQTMRSFTGQRKGFSQFRERGKNWP